MATASEMSLKVTNIAGAASTMESEMSLSRAKTARVEIACGPDRWIFESYDDFAMFLIAHGLNHHRVVP